MKQFNADKELKKLNRKKNMGKYTKYSTFILSILLIIVSILYLTKADFISNHEFTIIDAKVGEFLSGDITLAYNVEGQGKKDITGIDDLTYLTSECTNGVSYTVTNGDWSKASLDNIGTSGTKCTLYFAKPTIKYYLDNVEVDKETAIENHFDISTSPSCTKNASITYNESDNTYTLSNVTETGTECSIYFKANPTYSVAIQVTNGTASSSPISVSYGESNTVTITPTSSNYYFNTGSCTNGYTITGMNTGNTYTSAQTITINNNNNNKVSTCTIELKIKTCEVTRENGNYVGYYTCNGTTGTIYVCKISGNYGYSSDYCTNGGGLPSSISCSCG